MFARTGRLMLRPGWPEDAQALHAALNDEAVARNLCHLPWPLDARDVLACLSKKPDPRFPELLLFRRTAGAPRLVGGCRIADHAAGPELRYWIGRASWGLGYATEAVNALLGMARSLGHRRLIAHHLVDNRASARVLEKAGFHPTGRSGQIVVPARREPAESREMTLELDMRSVANDLMFALPESWPYDAHILAA